MHGTHSRQKDGAQRYLGVLTCSVIHIHVLACSRVALCQSRFTVHLWLHELTRSRRFAGAGLLHGINGQRHGMQELRQDTQSDLDAYIAASYWAISTMTTVGCVSLTRCAQTVRSGQLDSLMLNAGSQNAFKACTA